MVENFLNPYKKKTLNLSVIYRLNFTQMNIMLKSIM